MRDWVVASGIVEGPDGVLLVQNRRRDGSHDWSPPGGVVEVGDGEDVRSGLTREVFEETGISVAEWAGPLYVVEAEATESAWRLRVEVFRAVTYSGQIEIDDPDGIVVDARWFPEDDCRVQLSEAWILTHEPLGEWLTERWEGDRSYRYRVDGVRPNLVITRL